MGGGGCGVGGSPWGLQIAQSKWLPPPPPPPLPHLILDLPLMNPGNNLVWVPNLNTHLSLQVLQKRHLARCPSLHSCINNKGGRWREGERGGRGKEGGGREEGEEGDGEGWGQKEVVGGEIWMT